MIPPTTNMPTERKRHSHVEMEFVQVLSNVLVDLPWVLQDLVLGHPYQCPIGKAAHLLVLIHPAFDPNTVQQVFDEVGALS